MALGSSWWSTDWRDDGCIPASDPFGSATVSIVSINTLWNSLFISGIGAIYQREFSHKGSHDKENGGMFYIRNVDTGEMVPVADLFYSQGSKQGDFTLFPDNETADEIETFDELQMVRYTNPLFRANSSDTANLTIAASAVQPAASGETFVIDHYGPWAWYGVAAKVIAAILLRLGVSTSWIDTTAIDNAYDGETADHGPIPPVSSTRIYVARVVGKPIIDTIKRASAHSWTRIGYTMSGKFSCWSGTRPVELAASDIPSASIKSTVSWTLTEEHLYNQVTAQYGQVCRTTLTGAGAAPTVISGYEEIPNASYSFRSEWDPNLSSARSDRWMQHDEDATSQTAYGLISLGGVDEKGKPQKLHHEMMFDFYAVIPVLARVDKFCQPLHEITLKQDFRGLDYEVGTLITGYVCSDGETINMFCIEKEIDFENMEVTSKFLEDLA